MKISKKTRVQNYSILKDVILKGIFGVTSAEHAALKNVKEKDLRDHLTPLELIFTALGEESFRKLITKSNANTFEEKYLAAQKVGNIAGKALKNFENSQNIKVLS